MISRNTAFAYRRQSDRCEAARPRAWVRYVLEGSVRRTGDQVRVNVQLIDAESGAHLWADRFETEPQRPRPSAGRDHRPPGAHARSRAGGGCRPAVLSRTAGSIPMRGSRDSREGDVRAAYVSRGPAGGPTGIRPGARNRPGIRWREDRPRSQRSPRSFGWASSSTKTKR